jgi:hypothetical protein
MNHSDGKEVKVATQQTAADVDQVKRMSSNPISADYGALPCYAHPPFQGTNCEKAFTNGSPHQILQPTITSHVVLITRRLRLGFFKAASFRSGNQQVHCFGFTENVCPVLFRS